MLRVHTDPHVYGPEEDTYFLLETLKKEDLSGYGLEIGVGTGLIALNICHLFEEFTGVDINLQAVKLARKNAQENNINCQFLESDLFSSVSSPFDVIIFNPPYVPADEECKSVEDLSYHGGEDGRQTIDQFLSQFGQYLNPGGRVYLLQSSLSGIDETSTILKTMKYAFHIIARQKLFFEELVVFKIVKEDFL